MIPLRNILLSLFFISATLSSANTIDDKVNHGVILLYHHVSTDTPAITSIAPEHFAEQMQFLEDNQFTVWPLPRLVKHLQTQQPVPDKTISITFDDNYESVYHTAFPLLKKRGWPFTIFVSTDAVDQRINMQASWDQLREMAKAGATIANHTATHAHMLQRLEGENSKDWKKRMTRDIEKAQRRIREETGQEHNLFAYPYGEVDKALATLVKNLGYIGIGQHSGPVEENYPGLSLPRFPFAGRYSELDDFSVKAMTLPLPLKAASGPDAVLKNDEFKPKLVLTFPKQVTALKNLQCYGSGQGELPIKWLDEVKAEIHANSDLKPGRSRYNCTLPSDTIDNGIRRFHWYSHPWIRPTDKGIFLD